MRQLGIGWRRIARQKKRIEELERHEKERRDNEEVHRELRFGVKRKLKAEDLGRIEVEVFPKYCQVRLLGLYSSQIKPHLEYIKDYKESFEILTPPIGCHVDLVSRDLAAPDRYYKDPSRTGKSRWTLTFGSDTGLKNYLEFNGWLHLLDKP
ncbi:hypothetical protein BH24ACT20_BH24ACT20_02910 [soil metagenome]